MNAFITAALITIAKINANNALVGDDLFEDCGLNFDLLTDREEAYYDSAMAHYVTLGYDETVRLNVEAVERANKRLVERQG